MFVKKLHEIVITSLLIVKNVHDFLEQATIGLKLLQWPTTILTVFVIIGVIIHTYM